MSLKKLLNSFGHDISKNLTFTYAKVLSFITIFNRPKIVFSDLHFYFDEEKLCLLNSYQQTRRIYTYCHRRVVKGTSWLHKYLYSMGQYLWIYDFRRRHGVWKSKRQISCHFLFDGRDCVSLPTCHHRPPSKHQTLNQCWSIVYDAGPTLTQHWFKILCLLGCDPPHLHTLTGRWVTVVPFSDLVTK